MTAKAIAYWNAIGSPVAKRTADAIAAHMGGGPATRQTLLAIRKGETKGGEVGPLVEEPKRKAKGKRRAG